MTGIQLITQTQTIVVDSAGVPIIVGSPEAAAATVVASGPVGPPGVQGPPGIPGSTGYDFTQASALTTWTINHNLGYKPAVQLFTVGGLEVIGEILHTSNNQVLVSFNEALSGSARLI